MDNTQEIYARSYLYSFLMTDCLTCPPNRAHKQQVRRKTQTEAGAHANTVSSKSDMMTLPRYNKSKIMMTHSLNNTLIYELDMETHSSVNEGNQSTFYSEQLNCSTAL